MMGPPYWRPGCLFCMMLRLGLRRARVRAEWINIWDDPAAAAEVRDLTGGGEALPPRGGGVQAMGDSPAPPGTAARRGGPPRRPPAPGNPRASRLPPRR